MHKGSTVFAGDKAAAPHRPHPNFDISKRGRKKKKKKGKKKKTDKTTDKTLFF